MRSPPMRSSHRRSDSDWNWSHVALVYGMLIILAYIGFGGCSRGGDTSRFWEPLARQGE